jgi:hypothetical protein
MSIFDFLKHKKKVEEETITTKYNLENLPSLIDEEDKKINDNSERLKNELKEMVNHFSSEIKGKIPELKLINLDNRKEEQRLKDIVMTNLNDYIDSLEKLIEDLERIETNQTEKYVEKIQFIFNYFSKSSRMVYERATILIGKKLAEVRNITNNFAKEFNEKLELNKENSEKMNLIKTIQDNLKEWEEAKEVQKQIERSVVDFEKKIAKIKEEKQLVEKNYEEYKKSNEAKKVIESQEILKQENKNINDDLLKLKQDINLKSLAKYFHNDSKKNKIIKKYSENFLDSLKDDSNLEIISLIKEANQKFDEEKIKKLRQRILEQNILTEDVKIQDFNNLLLKLDSELKYESNKIEKEKEKILKFKEKQDQILTKIEDIAKKVWKDFKIK